jgi:hypothetical protein
MASGSPSQERATDQQCDHCHRWYDARGIDAHDAHCDGPPSARDRAGAFENPHEAHCDGPPDPGETETESIDEDSTAPSLFDPLAEQETEPTETETENTEEPMSETPNCPNCSTEQVTTTEQLQVVLANRGRLTPENLKKTRQNTHYCVNCNEVFSDE